MDGLNQGCSEQHLKRYSAGFDFGKDGPELTLWAAVASPDTPSSNLRRRDVGSRAQL